MKEFLNGLEKCGAEFVDFRFTDLRGILHHITYPLSGVDAELLREGIFFDGSSIEGWCTINNSDMLLVPDLSASKFRLDPFFEKPTLGVCCNVKDPLSSGFYNKDPRYIAMKAEEYLRSSGIAEVAYFGPELEFFLFDSIHFSINPENCFYKFGSSEFSANNSDIDQANHGYRTKPKSGYLPVAPMDSMQDIRSQMSCVMQDMGIVVEKHHHEVASAQHEIGIRFGSMLESADNVQLYKYVVRNVARLHGQTATFMPKPLFGDNGSGMHVHQSLGSEGKALFYGSGYANLSELALYYIGGILKHVKSLNAFTNSSTNSYKRLVPGFEAPVICAYSMRNRSAACRIPIFHKAEAARVEFRFPDPSANPYLAFSAMLLAGLDGIKNKIHPGESRSEDLYEEMQISSKLPSVASSLREALDALESDYEYLTIGEVFDKELLESYVKLKRHEVEMLERFPHPVEFYNYYGV
jgi:glutamine synthetase